MHALSCQNAPRLLTCSPPTAPTIPLDFELCTCQNNCAPRWNCTEEEEQGALAGGRRLEAGITGALSEDPR
eukprot:6191947-Pleurochrysis_carterae.AAC.2